MRRRILLADDSVTIQKVIELTFMDEDYDVKAVSNGDEALAALPDVKPDVVIADVHMPGANGYEVCRRSKEIQPDVPVLLLVGTFEPFDEGQARAAGADSFLKKPFDSQELLQRVQDLISSRPAAGAAPVAAPPPLPPLETDLGAALPPLDLGSFDPAPAFETSAGFDPAPAFQPAAAETDWGSFQLEPEPAPAAAPPPSYIPAPEPFEPFPATEPAPRLDSPFLEEEVSPFVLEDDRSVTAFEEVEAFPVEEAPVLPAGEPMFELDSPPPFPVPQQVAGFAAWTEEAAPAELEPQPWSPEPAPWSPPPVEPLPVEPLPPIPSLSPIPPAATAAPAEEPPLFKPLPMPVSEPPVSEPPVSEPLAAEPPAAAAHEGNGRLGNLSDEDVDRIARRVVELMGDKAVRDIAWEVIPDLAEVVIRSRLRELEAQVENPAE